MRSHGWVFIALFFFKKDTFIQYQLSFPHFTSHHLQWVILITDMTKFKIT